MNEAPLGVYFTPTEAFLDELANDLSGKRVLEVFGGRGYLAGQLSQRGVDVRSTSVLSSMDGHEYGLYYDVEPLNAVDAIKKYYDTVDILLMSYPTADNGAQRALITWGADKPVVYIGERTPDNPEKGWDWASCASDDFHKSLLPEHYYKTYEGRGRLACAFRGVATPDVSQKSLPSKSGLEW